ncbi:MAG: nitrate reductase cytochrome c-type subunit [Thermodesulfobacteriota bacterium]
MKKRLPFILMTIVGSMGMSALPASAEPVKAMSATEVNAPSPLPQPEKAAPAGKPIKRDFAQQPPLIPHTIDDYTIDKDGNQCLGCHGKQKNSTTPAARISPSHYLDSTGRETADLAGRHYFCTSCHVSQSDAKPLVPNTFKPASPVKKK